MIRIYPVPFRKLQYDQQYSKYDWLEIDLVKNTSDFRPESFRPNLYDSPFKKMEHLDTQGNWYLRKQICLKNVYTNLEKLISEAKDKSIVRSLAVFKPTKILDFTAESVESNWDKDKLKNIIESRKQLSLFEDLENDLKLVKKLPFKFKYKFLDDTGKESNMMIEDWETGQLFWKQLEKYSGDSVKAVADVKSKYFDDFAKTKDLHFYLGTTLRHHYPSLNPFMIIGTFTPKKEMQLSLF
jgi:hypothetical protein